MMTRPKAMSSCQVKSESGEPGFPVIGYMESEFAFCNV